MFEENISQEFSLKKLAEIRNFLFKEINHNELISRKHKMVCATLKYTEHCLILASTILQLLDVFRFLYLFI